MFDAAKVEKYNSTLSDRLKKNSGPWNNEPMRKEFKHLGFDCLIQRGPVGAWCGYVAVSKGHPWFEKHYDAVDAEVHGGLTFSEHCGGLICHPSDNDTVWWLGFDCSHSGDIAPLVGLDLPRFERYFERDIYRDEAYVTEEVKNLAKQAEAALASHS